MTTEIFLNKIHDMIWLWKPMCVYVCRQQDQLIVDHLCYSDDELKLTWKKQKRKINLFISDLIFPRKDTKLIKYVTRLKEIKIWLSN